MLVAAVSLVLNYFIKFPSFPDETAASFRRYRDRKLPLQIETSDAATLERYFAAEGVPSAVRTLDPAAYTLKGGRAQRVLNRKSSWSAYQGPRNTWFVLQMHPGSLAELPAGAEIRWDRGRSFHIYAQQGATVVFWQESNICCALISDASAEETIRLAQASMKV
jgi:anti-sigma factor RsiW